MRDRWDLVAITNDIYTKEDQRLLTVSGALAAERIMGVETGGCPHTAIREDASINLEAIDRMLEAFPEADIVFVESGGDNLAATFSPELSDLTIYVIDVAAGEKIPHKGGPGITKSGLFARGSLEGYRQVNFLAEHLRELGWREHLLGGDDDMFGCDMLFSAPADAQADSDPSFIRRPAVDLWPSHG